MMNGLITHEESQAVATEFNKRSHNFYSCDLQECSGGHPEYHIVGDCFHVIQSKFFSLQFLGCHPVCRFLANSGVRWLTSKKPKKGYEWSEKYSIYMNMERYEQMRMAAIHFRSCLSSVKSIGKGYVENPVMHPYAMEIIGEQPTQIIQPYMFGTTETKATCLWLVGLPKLKETNNVYHIMKTLPKKETDKVHYASPGPDREKIRSKTYLNIARAMAEQWG